MFGRKKEKTMPQYDLDNQKAVIRCSICTGEQVAGFKDTRSGKFEEVMLIRDSSDLELFKSMYGIKEITKEY